MTDLIHLNALEQGLHNERMRLLRSRSSAESRLRAVWIVQAEKEIAAERAFLGLPPAETVELSLDELENELLDALKDKEEGR